MTKEELIENKKWRYATKKFDASKKIDAATVEAIKESLNLTASSYGLQPFKFILVENTAKREELVSHSYGQRQVADASHLIVLAAKTSIDAAFIEEYVARCATARNAAVEDLAGFSDMMKGSLLSKSSEEITAWATKQVYIALGGLLDTCAHLRIDAVPMEGFNPAKYNEVLGLNERGLHAAVLCPIGFRAEDDGYSHAPKVRQVLNDIFVSV